MIDQGWINFIVHAIPVVIFVWRTDRWTFEVISSGVVAKPHGAGHRLRIVGVGNLTQDWIPSLEFLISALKAPMRNSRMLTVPPW